MIIVQLQTVNFFTYFALPACLAIEDEQVN